MVRAKSRLSAGAATAVLLAGLALSTGARATAAISAAADLEQMSIEELANVEITSVSKRAERLSQAPAAVYVISRDDIRRSGALNVPEVLRLAPNLQVAQRNSADYVISARGFNGINVNNKLLVLIDGRSVYSPLLSQVFWDSQEMMLDDIERIEVISGPGGVLWGANAVNGVINIITRSAADSAGISVSAAGGPFDRKLSLRYGGALGQNANFRIYARGFDRDSTPDTAGVADDDFGGLQTGFRIDGGLGQDSYTLQGDLYRNMGDGSWVYASGHNVLGRWNHPFSADSALTVQAYMDRAYRSGPGVRDRVNTYDLQAQQNLAFGGRHQVVVGGGYRFIQDRFLTNGGFFLDPPERDVSLANVFAQDEIALRNDLRLTLGLKLEDSSFSGLELMPSLRLAWRSGETGLLWASISRSVRTPSTVERDLVAPPLLQAAHDFDAESVIAYEAGYRVQPNRRSTLSVSVYYNDYDRIRSLGLADDPAFLQKLRNDLQAQTYGLEAWGDYRANDNWLLSGGVNLLHKDVNVRPGGIDLGNLVYAGNDPELPDVDPVAMERRPAGRGRRRPASGRRPADQQDTQLCRGRRPPGLQGHGRPRARARRPQSAEFRPPRDQFAKRFGLGDPTQHLPDRQSDVLR